MSVRIIILLIALCISGASWSALAGPRQVVDGIADLIGNNYFDPIKGEELADQLRRSARAGEFDALESRDLAVALNARLRPVDRHFNVVWARARAASDARVSFSPQPFGGRSAYGFRAVEMLPGAIGYIDMRFFAYFSFRKPDEPERLAADAALQLISGASAVIVDLRNNFGGWAPMVGYIVSAFVTPDANVYNVVHGRDGMESERPVQAYRAPRTDVPLYVLVSGNTASAAESAAYTLQAAKRAIVVGEPTSGAANPGGEFPVGEGFNVFISIATPVNPITGTNWEGIGVQPDVRISAGEALRHARMLALERMLAQAPQAASATDLQWALEALRVQSQAQRAAASLTQYVGTFADATVSIANGSLLLQRARRPASGLVHLHGDTFSLSDEPLRRVVFERDAGGKINGFQLLRSSGQAVWFPR